MAGVLLDVMRQANEDAGDLIPYAGLPGSWWEFACLTLTVKQRLPGHFLSDCEIERDALGTMLAWRPSE